MLHLGISGGPVTESVLVGAAAWATAVVVGFSFTIYARLWFADMTPFPGLLEFSARTARGAFWFLAFGAFHCCAAQLPLLLVWGLASSASEAPRRRIAEGVRATLLGTLAFPLSAAWVRLAAPPLCALYDYRFGPPFYHEHGQVWVLLVTLLPPAALTAVLCRSLYGPGEEGGFRFARLALWALLSLLFSWQVYGFAMDVYPALVF